MFNGISIWEKVYTSVVGFVFSLIVTTWCIHDERCLGELTFIRVELGWITTAGEIH
jgi:hypothetical protein